MKKKKEMVVMMMRALKILLRTPTISISLIIFPFPGFLDLTRKEEEVLGYFYVKKVKERESVIKSRSQGFFFSVISSDFFCVDRV